MNSSTRLILTFAGGGVLVLVAYFALLNPALSRVAELSAEESLARAEIQRLEDQILAFKTAQSDLSKAANKDLVFDAVVEEKQLYLPIESMEQAADATGTTHTLKILKDSVSQPQPVARGVQEKKIITQPELAEVPYVLSLENSSFLGIVDFLRYFERNPYFTEISQIDLFFRAASENSSAALNGTVNGVFVVQKPSPQEQP